MFASKDLFFTRPSGYQISRSVRTRASASGYFNRTPASASNQQKWTWSGWVKRGQISTNQTFFACSYGTSNRYAFLRFNSSDNLAIYSGVYSTSATTDLYNYVTTPVYRDPSAWYHIVFALDTTQATASNRAKLYVNGVQVTSFSAATDPALNGNGFVNSATIHTISSEFSSLYLDGYLTEVNFIDGQQLTPSSFGQTNTVTGVWQPIKYTGTYGTNGFYLNFSDNSSNTATTIGKDYSGNGNNWTPNNISVTAGATYDSMLDVPTLWADGGNGRGNYCVLNPLDKNSSGTIADGNLATSSQTASAHGSFGLTTGKWYFEASFSSITGVSSLVEVGIEGTNIQGYLNSGNKDLDTAQTSYGATYTTSDIIGCAFDLDAKQMTFYKNGTSQGTFTYTVADTYFPMFRARGTTTFAGTINFGQRPFTYTPPTGFVALNTQNLPTPTISNGANYMAATTWTSNGSTQSVSNAVNGISFKPDLVWNKSRSGVGNHVLNDSVRGAANYLSSNLTNAEAAASTYLTSFDSGGFSLGTGNFFGNATSVIAWQWQAGAGSTSSNTSGSITSTVSAGATQGFSVVTYTGTGANATVGHGLGVAPKMVIAKVRSAVNDWVVYHASLGGTQAIFLDLTNAATTNSLYWNNTNPTSSVFSIGTSSAINLNAGTYVAYCFSEVAGYSKFGSYTGNGSADGVFVYCGFRPRFILIKSTSSGTASWFMYDTSRSTYNAATLALQANTSDAELTGRDIDILSNGFKCRSSDANFNANAGTYIFMAVAENPFKLSLAR